MRHLIVSSFLLALLALAPARLVAAAPLRMLVLANSAMPLAEIKDAQVQGGLLKDIGELIAREADMPLNLTVMPRNRIAETLERRQADIYCDTLPEWLPATLKDLHWSAPVSWNPQYLVSAAPRRAPERWSQLKGSTVVTLLGYEYPKPAELARGFAEGQWQRSDAISEELLLRRLQLGRGDYGIVGALALNWFRKRRPDARFNVGIALVTEPTRCVLVESPGFPLAQVLRAIKRLADKGELQRLPLRYRPDH